jgi:hypothetical protein
VVGHDPAESHHDPSAAPHGDAHADDGHGGGHGDRGEALGPIDWRAWGAALLGVVGGLVVAASLYISSHPA